MQGPPLGHQAFSHVRQDAAEHRTEGVGVGDMGHQALAEEAEGPLMGAIDELIGHHHVEGA